MIRLPVVVVETIVLSSYFGAPKQVPAGPRSAMMSGSAELAPVNLNTLSKMDGDATTLPFGMKRGGSAAFNSQGSPTANVAATAVWTRCVVVNAFVSPMAMIPVGWLLATTPVRNTDASSTFF